MDAAQYAQPSGIDGMHLGKMGTRSSERQSLSLSYKKIVFSES